jgi:hypothetical protein
MIGWCGGRRLGTGVQPFSGSAGTPNGGPGAAVSPGPSTDCRVTGVQYFVTAALTFAAASLAAMLTYPVAGDQPAAVLLRQFAGLPAAVSIRGALMLLAVCAAGIAGACRRRYRSSVPVSSGKMAPAAIPRTSDAVPAA